MKVGELFDDLSEIDEDKEIIVVYTNGEITYSGEIKDMIEDYDHVTIYCE